MISKGLLMGPRLGREAGVTGTVARRQDKHDNYPSESVAILRTLTARIHPVFSCGLNALHSLRMAGLVQGVF